MKKLFVVVQAVVVVFLAMALSSLPALAAAGAVKLLSDNETVYVLMNNDGAPRETILMDWLRVEGTGSYDLRDPLPGAQGVRLVDGPGTLAYDGKTARVSGTATGIDDIYYRATLTKPLPVDVEITPTIGGTAVTYDDLKQRAGDVTIVIDLRNKERQGSVYVPWTYSLSFTLNNADIRSVDAGTDGVVAVTGSRTIITYMTVLDASARVTLRYTALRGTNPNVQLVLQPSLPAFSLPSADSLLPLEDGLGKLALAFDGQRAMLNGIINRLGSQAVPAIDTTQIDRLNDIVTLLKADEAVLRGLYAGIDPAQLASLADVPGAVARLRQSLDAVIQGVGQLAGALTVQSQLVEEALNLNVRMGQAVDALPAEFTGQFAGVIAAQRSLLETAAHGGAVQGVPAPVPGLATIAGNLTNLQKGLSELAAGFGSLAEGLAPLSAMAGSMTTLRTTIGTVLDGGQLAGQTLPPFATTSNAIAQIPSAVRAQAEALTSAGTQSIGELVQTLSLLRDGGSIGGRFLPSLLTLKQGALSMKTGIGKFATTLQNQTDLMAAKRALAKQWTSFGGRSSGVAGSVMFVFTMAQ